MVEVFADPGDPLQPATSMNTIIAPAIPMRVRNRWAAGIMNNIAIAIMMKSTCRSNADGGAFKDCGGTMKEVAVMDPVAVAPGAGAALVVGTAHEEINMRRRASERYRSGKSTQSGDDHGERAGMPLATVMAAAETEKSHAGPVSGTVLTLPPVCVIVSVPETGPGGVAAIWLKVTVTTHGFPLAAITIGNAPLLQAGVFEVSRE